MTIVRLSLALSRLKEACADCTNRAECRAIDREADRVHEQLLRDPMNCAAILAALRKVSHRVIALANRPPERFHAAVTSAELLRALLQWLEQVCALLEQRIKGSPPPAS